MIVLILFGLFIFNLVIGVPIAVSIGVSAVVSFLYIGFPLSALTARMFAGINIFTLLAIPFFMLAGSLMSEGGMSRRLVRLANSIVGTFPGGLALVQVLASMFFGALSGSSTATAAAIGTALIPEMEKRGFPKEFSAAVQSVAGTVGSIIPPSIPMVIYGVVASQSIGKLFIAGFIPGIIYGSMLMIVIYFISRKRKYISATDFSFKEVRLSFKESVWALIVPLIILGGIYSGIFTPTEAGAVACFYGLFVGIFIYKELNLGNLSIVFTTAAINTAMVLLIISTASVFSWILNIKGVANLVGSWLANVTENKLIFLIITNVLLLFMGCFMETIACILITTPILLPVAISLGIDPIHFGILMVMNLSLGMSTPPVGENIYICASIAKIPIEPLIKNLLPLMMAAILAILIVLFFPSVSLFLVNTLY